MKPKYLYMRSVRQNAGKLVHIFYNPAEYWFYPITTKRKTLLWGKGHLRYGKWISITGEVSLDPQHPLYQTIHFPRSKEERPLGWLAIKKDSPQINKEGDSPHINKEGYTVKAIPLSACWYFTLHHAETMYYLDVPEKDEVPAPRENFFHSGYRYRYKKGQK